MHADNSSFNSKQDGVQPLHVKEERTEMKTGDSSREAEESQGCWDEEQDSPHTPGEGCDDLTSEAKPAVIWDSPVSSELNVRRAQGPGASQEAPNTSQGQRITNTAQLDGTTQLRLGRFAETAGAGAGVEVGPGHHAASLTAEQGSDGPGMGEKSSRCGQCGKTFTTRFYLKIHQRIHTGERPYTCLQCGKRFYCNSHLISHQRCHTGEKPYSCEECGKSYSHLNSLKLHQRSHTEEEAYGYCSCKDFSEELRERQQKIDALRRKLELAEARVVNRQANWSGEYGIASIMDVLAKAAVVEISKLLAKEDAVALRLEIKRRDDEIENLVKRLQMTEGELHRMKATVKSFVSGKCSVAVQVETSRDMLGYGGTFLPDNQFCAEAPPPFIPCEEATRILESDEDLEFEMKIEQVEEPNDEKRKQTQSSHSAAAEQNHPGSEYRLDQRSSQLWSSVAVTENGNQQEFGEPEYSGGFEQRRKDFLAQAEQYAAAHMLMEDGSCSLAFADKANVNSSSSKPLKSNSHDGGEGVSGVKETVAVQQARRAAAAAPPKPKPRKASHAPSVANDKRALAPSLAQLLPDAREHGSARFKIYPCRECGKRFTQRNRLVSHQWVHTGERPFRCQICGKMFSRHDNCQRHERLHSLLLLLLCSSWLCSCIFKQAAKLDMAPVGVLQSQITAILNVLTKAAVAEISQLIEEDSVVLHLEIKRREDEIEGLKKRLQLTEKELKKVQAKVIADADKCSIGVQVEMLDTDLIAYGEEPPPGNHIEIFNTSLVRELKEEKPQLSHKMGTPLHHMTKERQAPPTHVSESSRQDQVRDEEDFSGLEFEMKIEQVEELVDQELSLPRADYRVVDPNTSSEHKADQRDTHLWSSADDDTTNDFGVPDGCIVLEQYDQLPTEDCIAPMLKDPPNTQSDVTSKHVDSFRSVPVRMERAMHYEGGTLPKDTEYGQLGDNLNHMTSQRQQAQSSSHLPSNASGKPRHSFGAVPRPHTHIPSGCHAPPPPPILPLRGRAPVVHIGSKPFRCEECGKGFTQRTRLITHKRIHTGEKPYHCQLCGKMFSRQDNCLRHVRLHSGQR
ncbi:hypothetical protein P4O66_014719, partial [Electrophorus voltai]